MLHTCWTKHAHTSKAGKLYKKSEDTATRINIFEAGQKVCHKHANDNQKKWLVNLRNTILHKLNSTSLYVGQLTPDNFITADLQVG